MFYWLQRFEMRLHSTIYFLYNIIVVFGEPKPADGERVSEEHLPPVWDLLPPLT